MTNRFRTAVIAWVLSAMIAAASLAQAAEPADKPAVLGPFGFSLSDAREFLLIVAAVISTVGPILWWALRTKLAGEFAAKRELQELTARLGGVESELHRIPSEADFKDLSKRVGQLEGAVSVAAANLDGLKTLLNRIDYSVKLLVKHHINGGADE